MYENPKQLLFGSSFQSNKSITEDEQSDDPVENSKLKRTKAFRQTNDSFYSSFPKSNKDPDLPVNKLPYLSMKDLKVPTSIESDESEDKGSTANRNKSLENSTVSSIIPFPRYGRKQIPQKPKQK